MGDLATQQQATAFGYGTIAAGYFKRASARVRAYTRQQIDAGTTVLEVRAPVVLLPQRPVRAVTSVVNAAGDVLVEGDDWVLRGGGILEIPNEGGQVTVEYAHGFETVPDEIVEIVCGIAARMSTQSDAASAGVIQETGGSESVSYGFDSYKAVSALSAGEMAMLDRLFPKRGGVVVTRP